MIAACSGIRVVEDSGSVAAAHAGKLLADAGADVIKVEPPAGGDPLRRRGPFARPGRTHGALFLTLFTNKRSVTLRPEVEAGAEIYRRLLATADVWIVDRAPGALDARGLAPRQVAGSLPRLVVASLTPFGLHGPRSRWRMGEGNLAHAGAQAWLLYHHLGTDRPLNLGGLACSYDAGVAAAVAVVAALLRRSRTGTGQRIDISLQEVAMAMDRVLIGRYASEGVSASQGVGRTISLLPCRDGFVIVNPGEEWHWKSLCVLMGEPAWTRDPAFSTRAARIRNAEALNERLAPWFAGQRKEDVYHRCQRASVPVGSVRDASDVAASAQMRARGFFLEYLHPDAGPVSIPQLPFTSSLGGAAPARPAPAAGAHNRELLLGELGIAEDALEAACGCEAA